MANLLTVDLTAGVPTVGTGTVMTINSLSAQIPAALAAGGGLKIEGVAGGVTVPVTGTITAVTAITNALPAGANAIGKLAANSGVNIGTVTVDSTQLAALQGTQPTMASPGSQSVILPSDMPWPKGLSNKAFVAAFSTITRPADTNIYAAADHIANSTTAGSVTAKSATISDTNDDPIFLSDILVSTTDTGVAGKKIRAYLFNSDPTASSGVSGGDNAAYAQKVAGYIGSFMGWMETGFSDGAVGRLVPCFNETNFTQAGGFVTCKPTSGAKTLFIQLQAVEAFTPVSASVWTMSARGWQGRAA